MKKTILAALLAAGVADCAVAQSSVTVSGSIDAGLRHLTNVNAAGDSRLSLNSKGNYKSNHLAFRGVEDLGNGMNAHFHLESGFESGTGALDNTAGVLFRRQIYVGLGSQWGSVDLGRQYSIAFRVVGAYEPFEYKYTELIPLAGAVAGTRFNNDIQYTGKFGPMTVRAEYALGEVAGSQRNGAAQAVGLVYGSDALTLGGAYTRRTLNLAAVGAADYRGNDSWTLGGAYNLGAARITAGYARETQETARLDNVIKSAWTGVKYNLSAPLAVTGAFYQVKTDSAGAIGKRDFAIIGLTYALSKRTNLYSEIDRQKYKGLAIVNGQTAQTGISFGINHYF